MTHKNRKKSRIFMFINTGCSLLRDEGSAIRKNAGSGSVSGSALNQCGSETLI
jgi:hypothetical protein